MSAGGPRRFSVGTETFARAISPYELEFSVVHEARGNLRHMPGIFSEQAPLGFPCHVVDAGGRWGSEYFGCVASDMTLLDFGGARVSQTTLLKAEELVFALITMCSVKNPLRLGFSPGPGGSKQNSQAALSGLCFHPRDEAVIFRRYLPGLATLEKINAIRTAIMENLVSPAEAVPINE